MPDQSPGGQTDRDTHAEQAAGDADRQPAALGPCRVHPAWIAIGVIGWFRALGLPLLIALVTGGSRFSQIFYAAATVLAAAITLVRILEWTRFRYEVSGGELRVTSGLFSRQERLVPLERIQAVDINENLLQRLFGVVGVKIETAAGGQARTDVNLEALTRSDALRLRDRLARAGPAATDPPPSGDRAAAMPADAALGRSRPIRTITPIEVVIIGATSARIGPAAAIVVTGLELFDQVLGRTITEVVGIERGFTFSGVLFLLSVMAAGGWLLAIAGAVLTYGRFAVRRDGDRLLIDHGLLDRRRRTIPIARIQAIHITEGLLQQPFGLASVQFDSAGYGRASADSGMLFPLLPRTEVAAFLAAACPALAARPELPLNRPPARARPRYVLAPVWAALALAALAVVAVLALAWAPWWWTVPIVAAAASAGALLGHWQYRAAGWALDTDGRLIVRGRTLGRHTAITLPHRVQHYSVHRTLFQRRARLASFGAAVASGGRGRIIAIAHLDEAVAFGLAGRIRPTPRPPPSQGGGDSRNHG